MLSINHHAKILSVLAAVLTTALIIFANPTVHAADEVIIETPAEVERWYIALGSVNRQEFKELIADDAKIVLKDLGIEQNKQEFISALDAWENATRDANIIYRYESIEDSKASVLVCYRFKTNEQLNIESFTFAGNQITGSVQDLKGTDCGAM